MPAEEPTGKTAERCRVHPGSHAVASCDVCGRSVCLACAIPVRGRTLGAECLSTVLGPDAPVTALPEPEPAAAARTLARVAFALAVVATMLPWSRFGPGSEALGAWGRPLRWSTVVAVAAVVGLLLSTGRWFRPGSGSSWDAALAATGALVSAGALLAIWRPPDFGPPWVGPWVAVAAGLVACVASATALLRRREPERVRG